ncbi:helix-turn-helix domain-containing protein [Massilia endophytica]|uniref:helix-turn-helix domain-containing protein n=1 Tax=Massilia endophytica TaxID=2899220 RepID=UPI001E2D1A14|nr:AraC family transcriptional regulator [Massilia endophytica]UGQ46270.1 AraC family transcriptional regulator [Massilia endophytica]
MKRDDTSMLARPQSVFGGLAATGLAPLRHMQLGDGMALTLWERDTEGLEIAYSQPGHHTLAYYLKSGRGTRRLDGASALQDEEICSLPYDHASRWLVRGRLRFLHLYFKPELLERRATLELDRDARLVRLDDRSHAPGGELQRLCGRLAVLPWQGADAPMQANELAHETLSCLLRAQGEAADVRLRGGLQPAVRRRVRDYIEAHLHGALTLGMLADVACMSEYHFLRMFRASFGLPPHAWIAARRIDRARQLLRSTDLPLQRIADDCGYATLSHFSHSFRSALGCAPSRFRAQLP